LGEPTFSHCSVNNLRDKKVLITFGARVKILRQERNMTLQSLAFEAEMEISQVHRIEKGVINPTLTTLNALAKAFNITLDDLVKI
jgi:transcriptional regulator with XRE-family HTH domain